MQIAPKSTALFLPLAVAVLMVPPCFAQVAPTEADRLVREFPTLDALESHLGSTTSPEGESPRPSATVNSQPARNGGAVVPVSARWFTEALAPDPFDPIAGTKPEPAEKPLTSIIAAMDEAQKEAGALNKEISKANSLPVNRYFLDRITASARTDYGTDVTGFFTNGIGFGTFQQTLLQNYGLSYTVPLLQRYSKDSKWKRVLSGWTFSSSIAAMPELNQVFELRQFLNNLQFTWDVALSYSISGSTLRRIQDGEYDKEAALGKANDRAASAREGLLKTMALRIDALSRDQHARDSRVTSLRELYPQFELYQVRYEQASRCDERMEEFFTLKGLALSLLTLAGYDQPDENGGNLLQTWKKAKFAGCSPM